MTNAPTIDRWCAVERSDLPDVLFGDRGIVSRQRRVTSPSRGRDRIHVGFARDDPRSPYQPPDLVVIDDDWTADTFAWLHAYAPNVSPLSQFARVLTQSDWMLSESATKYQPDVIRFDKWACLMFGEALAQGPLEVETGQVPLARAAACFTLPVARAAARFGREWQSTCQERLHVLARDGRFRSRNVSVEALSRLWQLVQDAGTEDFDPADASVLVLDAVMSPRSSARQLWAENSSLWEGGNSSDLLNESIEQRVRAFYRVAETLDSSKDPQSELVNAQLAVAAFLVGRGTSHAFLLRRAGRRYPTSQVWFGLLAALSGPRTWEQDWSRAVKSMERLARGSIAWDDSGGVDLFWAEYEWVSRTWEGLDAFIDLPRNQPGALTIELLPAVSCQLRLALPEAASEQQPEEPERERALSAYVREFVELAARAREALDDSRRGIGERTTSSETSSTRARRPKRSTG